MVNPYDPPIEVCRGTVDKRRVSIALIPFIVAVPAGIVAATVWFTDVLPEDVRAIVFGLAGMILVFDVPVCILVAIDWLRTGQPPPLSLSPLIPTREERELHRALRSRTRLNDDEFYQAFYAESGIPKSLVANLRRTLEDVFGLDFGSLHPIDNLIYADIELDWADLFLRIERDMGIIVPRDDVDALDGSFDSLLRIAFREAGRMESRASNHV